MSHAFVQSPHDPNEPDCEICGVMLDFHAVWDGNIALQVPASDGRPAWDDYFLGIAAAVAARADCRRARYGAVIVDRGNRVISTGYNGGPSQGPSCLRGQCLRGLLTAEELAHNSADYSNCVAVHAETNAIAYARSDCRDGTMYIAEADGNHHSPCDACSKLIIAAGIALVVMGDGNRILVTPSGLHGMGVLG